jgi:RES domain-containing protein
MLVFRIARDIYATQLMASGIANRWNLDQQFVLYTGASRSLATLELMVHRAGINPAFQYKMMAISVSDEANLFQTININDLPPHWRTIQAYSDLQKIGNEWYVSKASLVLKVPSVIIPSEFNYIINMRHSLFEEYVKLEQIENFYWDERLIQNE